MLIWGINWTNGSPHFQLRFMQFFTSRYLNKLLCHLLEPGRHFRIYFVVCHLSVRLSVYYVTLSDKIFSALWLKLKLCTNLNISKIHKRGSTRFIYYDLLTCLCLKFKFSDIKLVENTQLLSGAFDSNLIFKNVCFLQIKRLLSYSNFQMV